MPGEIVAITTRQAREARHVVGRLEGVKGAILMGDSVHVVVDNADRRSSAIKAALERTGVAADDAERIAPSIEDLFVALLTAEDDQ
jgi:ABC-2 type transport system ATP-binding protein